jgi:predicted HicB family RNase H-like nuclease
MANFFGMALMMADCGLLFMESFNKLYVTTKKVIMELERTIRTGHRAMKYKGYTGHVEYDEEAKLFHGEVLGIKDVVTFQGTTVDEIEQAFRDSVDDYLAFCKERGEEPDRPFSGKFNLRIPPDLHAKLSTAAQLQGESLNNYITKMLQRSVA